MHTEFHRDWFRHLEVVGGAGGYTHRYIDSKVIS
jgi:hypothetical protein